MKQTAVTIGLFALAAALAGTGAVVQANQTNPDSLALAADTHIAAAPARADIKRADFRGHAASADVQLVADWSVHSGDNKGSAFIIVDKVKAKVYVFDRHGALVDSAPVLVGMGVGDRFEPGVLDMDMYKTKPAQRVTPAGRYFAEEDLNLEGERVLWVDYDSGIAIHKLSAKRTKQRRHERMASPDPAQHRITYGCINVPPKFYDRVVAPHFRAHGGVVYVLPETMPINAVFRTNEIAPRLTRTAAGERPTTPQRF
jgi:hypothetical protein